jgi:hypothetical protein
MNQKQRAAPGTESEAAQKYSISKHNSTPTKQTRVLAALATGQSFNRFEAERSLNDHCLHSTVSTLQREGIGIQREWETVPGFRGLPTRVKRYRLDDSPESRRRAAELLTQPESLPRGENASGGFL